MSEKTRIAGATGGAVGLGAFAAALGTCCVAPWAVSLLGVSGAVALVRLSFLKPYLLGGAVLLLALSFRLSYRTQAAFADGSCETSSRRSLRVMTWLGAVMVGLLLVASLAPRLLPWDGG